MITIEEEIKRGIDTELLHKRRAITNDVLLRGLVYNNEEKFYGNMEKFFKLEKIT